MAARSDDVLDEVFHALSNATRRKMLRLLATGDRRVSDLAKPHAISRPACSKHLKVLEQAGLVTRLRQGQEHIIQLRTPGLTRAAKWLGDCELFWSTQLDELERLLTRS